MKAVEDSSAVIPGTIVVQYLASEIFCAIPSLRFSLPSLKSPCLFPTDGEAIDDYEDLVLFLCPLLRRLHVVEVPRVVALLLPSVDADYPLFE